MWFLPSFLRFPGGAITRITESSHRRLHVALGPMGRTHRRIVDRVLLTCVGHVSSCVDVGVLRWGAKASALCIAINASFSGPVGGLTKRYTTCSNILNAHLGGLPGAPAVAMSAAGILVDIQLSKSNRRNISDVKPNEEYFK